MKHRSLKMSPFLFASTFLLFAPPLLAIQIGEECSNDADCSDGGICQKDMWTNGCAAPSEDGAEKCDTTVHESETGFCYIPPEQCESDAECGEYLSCIEESSGSCTGSSDGETICTETKGPSYCGAASVVCESDADCPRSFECGEAQVICIAMDCPDGEPDCRQCDNEGRKECRPQQFDCESDSECPSDWSCFDTLRYECPDGEAPPRGDAGEGGGEDGDSSRSADRAAPAPEGGSSGSLPLAPDEGKDDVPQCVAVAVTGSCYPEAWGGGIDLAGGEADPTVSDNEERAATPPIDDDNEQDGAEDSASAEGVGCSVAPASPRGSSWWLALLLVLPALRRRQTGAAVVQRSQSH